MAINSFGLHVNHSFFGSSGSKDRIFLHNHDDLLVDEYDIANKFNGYFVNIANSLSISIERASYDIDTIPDKYKQSS